MKMKTINTNSSFIYNSRFMINFNIETLNQNVLKIDKKFIYFFLEENCNTIFDINNLIENKKQLNVEISVLNKNGETVFLIYLQKLIFIKFVNLIDFSYDYDDIIKIKVSYLYEQQKIFKNINQLKKYQRKEKLEKLNEYN